MINEINRINIHFKKDISGYERYIDFLKSKILYEIDKELLKEQQNNAYIDNLFNLKYKIELQIKHTEKRINMLK